MSKPIHEDNHVRQEFIAWCRSLGAIKVTVGDVSVEFSGRQPPQPPVPSPSEPSEPDDGEGLSPKEREKLRREKYMFWSSE